MKMIQMPFKFITFKLPLISKERKARQFIISFKCSCCFFLSLLISETSEWKNQSIEELWYQKLTFSTGHWAAKSRFNQIILLVQRENVSTERVKGCLLCLHIKKNAFKMTTVLSWTQMDTMDTNISVIVCTTIPKINEGTQLDGSSWTFSLHDTACYGVASCGVYWKINISENKYHFPNI